MAATPDPGQSSLNTMPGATVPGFGTPGKSMFSTFIFNMMPPHWCKQRCPDRRPKSYVLTKVEELLLDYGLHFLYTSQLLSTVGWLSSSLSVQLCLFQGPWYKLGVICGMASKSWFCFRGTTCYHVNFLASTPVAVPNGAATTSPPGCKLFFAEFWTRADDGFEPSKKPPVCCPIQDYHAFPGRCFICECASVRIVHPPCGNYFMGHEYSTDSLCAVAERHAELGE
ncbi:hypothetical protein ACQ4PT_002344 [Festuca glaucescens]